LPVPAGPGQHQLVDLPLIRSQVRGWKGDDEWTLLMLASATEKIEYHIGPVLPRPAVTERVHDPARRGQVVLGEAPVIEVTSCLHGDVAVTGWELDQEAGTLSGRGLHGAAVTYVPGRDEVPAAVQQAVLYVLQQVADSDQQGARPEGYNGPSYGPDTNAFFSTSRGFYLPNRARELLQPYWRRG
jgi:hypothetical protein